MKLSHILLIGILLCAILIGGVQATNYTSQYPGIYDITTAKSTTGATGYAPVYNVLNPANSLVDSETNGWLTDTNFVTNQMVNINLTSEKKINRVFYNNYHESGGLTTRGAKNFTLWGGNSEVDFKNVTWGTASLNWTQLTCSDPGFYKHSDVNAMDNHTFLVTNSISYKYYQFRIPNNYGNTAYLGIRRIELQTEDVVSPIPSFNSANVSAATNSTSQGWAGISPFTMQFTDTSSGSPTGWNWTRWNLTSTTPTVFNTSQNAMDIFWVGNWSVNLSATNAVGTGISAQTLLVNVSSGSTKPIAISSLSRSTMPVGSYAFFNDTSLNTPTIWCWTFASGYYAAVPNGTVYYYQRGIFNVSSNVSNSAGYNVSYNVIRII